MARQGLPTEQALLRAERIHRAAHTLLAPQAPLVLHRAAGARQARTAFSAQRNGAATSHVVDRH